MFLINRDFEEVSFEKNILKFINKKTQVVYLCDWETIKREDWKNPLWELTQLDKVQAVSLFLYKPKANSIGGTLFA